MKAVKIIGAIIFSFWIITHIPILMLAVFPIIRDAFKD